MQKYSITETHKNLSTLIHLIEETGTQIGITRGDKTVAVLAPKNERLKKSKLSPWEALMAFREEVEIESLDIDTEIFNERRAQDNGVVAN